jgi:hypothetical protein
MEYATMVDASFLNIACGFVIANGRHHKPQPRGTKWEETLPNPGLDKFHHRSISLLKS